MAPEVLAPAQFRPQPHTPRRGRWVRFLTVGSPWKRRLLVWGAIVAVWEIYGHAVGDFFFAPFSDTVLGVGRLVTDGYVPVFLASFRDMLIGYTFAVVIGVTIGVLGGAVKSVGHVVRPYSQAAFVTSLEALLPFLIVILGPGMGLKTTVVAMFAVFYILFNVEAGIRNTSPGLLEVSRSFRAPRVRTYLEVILPGALPYLMSGLRIGLGMALKGLIVAELWVSMGIGRLLRGFTENRELDMFLAVVLVLVLVGAGLVGLIDAMKGRVAPWSRG
jgi:ABC-type nitrate/sulfonate/bicarbonate transport system permease component